MLDAEKRLGFTFRKFEASKTAPVKPPTKEDEEVLDAGDEDNEESGARIGGKNQQVHMPARRVLGKDEIQEPDPTAYDMLHSMNVNWPCLSFDVLQDGLGDEQRGYLQMVYLVTGAQAATAKDNEVIVMKLSGLQSMQQSKEDDNKDDDGKDVEEDPILQSRFLQCPTTTNPIRASPHAHNAGSMAETGDVYNGDLSPHYKSFESPGAAIPTSANKPTATLRMHRHVEGHTIDWSSNPPDAMRRIAARDNTGKIFISVRKAGGTWATDGSPLMGHTGIDVSSSDAKVVSSCRSVPRTFPNTLKGEHVFATASFTFHQQPITSVEFYPTEDSIVSDLSFELDDNESRDTGGVEDIPPELLFVHYHKDVTEVHWKKVVTGTGDEG
ncbi:hypothetical protein L873DRAFT_1830249 [Choiromyces venosus 120613-1]|uniref:Histone-binding protein RBBP4-like N-terminal domain-containing protein n=1 Tax=Choiromyces venosus 120613-1 TaxID=1336337 RepID=A0A3N4J8J0_9PEZI|nr:hypothetical protein L873DRAFT_1830249 [Choiromyces venosus 120613-1]